VEYFYEAAHMRSFEMLWQIRKKVDFRGCILILVHLIKYADGVFKPFHPNFRKRDIPLIRLVLYIYHYFLTPYEARARRVYQGLQTASPTIERNARRRQGGFDAIGGQIKEDNRSHYLQFEKYSLAL
jgi:hypothetical protein